MRININESFESFISVSLKKSYYPVKNISFEAIKFSATSSDPRKIMLFKKIFVLSVLCAVTAADRFRRSADTCGKPNYDSGLIVKGRNFPRGTYPWTVALMHTGFSPPRFFCGGSLISATFVISGKFFNTSL